MCDADTPPSTAGPRAGRRRKLWELEDRFHCPVIGTCLTLEDLRKILRQSGVRLKERPTDFDLHVALVRLAGEKGRASRAVQKLLDRRFARHVRHAASLADERALSGWWREAARNGDLAGTFWALATHPALGETLARRLYGEIHMLSHISGRSHREALARIPGLERQVADLEAARERSGQHSREALAGRDRRIAGLERELERARAELRERGASAAEPVPAPDRALEEERRRADRLEARLAEREHRLDERAMEIQALKELLGEARDDLGRADELLRQRLDRWGPAGSGAARPDLGGRHVVYVGGRPSLTPHLRAAVERYSGRFTHHDGGKEDSRAGIESLLGSADLVFCPVDCVSHDACTRVKRYCRQRAAVFVPLRASSLSGFVQELQRVADTLPATGSQ